MDVSKECSHLAELVAARTEDLWRGCEVVDNGDRQNFYAHLLLYFTASALVLVGLLEFGDRVVVLVRQLPPLRAKLAHVVEVALLKAVLEG